MAVDPTPQQAQPQLPGIGPPFTGLYLDRPAHAIPPNGFSACQNVRVYQNQVTNFHMGAFIQIASQGVGSGGLGLGASVTGGGLLTLSKHGYQYLIWADLQDIFVNTASTVPTGYYHAGTAMGTLYITPVYNTGTVTCAGSTTAITGSGTAWNTAIGTGFRKNMMPGDWIYLNAAGSSTYNFPPSTAVNGWYQIATVTDDTHAVLMSAGPAVTGQAYTLRQCMSNDLDECRVVFETYPNAAALGGDFTDTGDLAVMANYGGSRSTFPNTIDPMVVWNPKNQFAYYLAAGNFVSALGFSNCGSLRRFNNVMIYGRLLPVSPTSTNQLLGTEMASSDNGDPRTFVSGIAFQGTVSDGAEPIVHLGILGNQLLIYLGTAASGSGGVNTAASASGSITSAQYVGFPTIWQFQTVIRERGPISGLLVAEFADRHQFIGVDGEYRYNGMFLQVMNDHIWRTVLNEVNFTVAAIQYAFHIAAPGQGDIIWVVPSNLTPPNGFANPNSLGGYTEHYMEQANSYLFKPTTLRDVGWNQVNLGSYAPYLTCFLGTCVSASVFGDISETPIVGDSNGNILQLYGTNYQPTGVNGAAGAMPASCTFGARVVAGERSRGLVKRVYPFTLNGNLDPSTYNLTVTLTMQDRVGGPTTITDVQQFPITNVSGNRFTTHYRRGRVAALTFSTVGAATGQTFTLMGYDWDLPGHGSAGPGGQR